MPELPEVEHAVRRLRVALVGRAIVRARALHRSLRRSMTPARLRSLAGRTVREVSRRGKHQLLHLDSGALLHVHFRMTGDWEWHATGAPSPAHVRFALELDDATTVVLSDSRALATVAFVRGVADLPALGPEADDPTLTADWLRAALRGRRGAIKTVLLDQRLLAGIGNIYASEALWHAQLSPRASAASLAPARVTRLLAGIRKALARGMAREGRHEEGESHEFLVYDREGAPCHRCGAAIRRLVQGQRSTYWCPRCQRV
ncbi:MAG: bifunctional DNA-formamidopyrimidine glycosylase/DNA-(apurinic or apyrimidinic site) lyase [Gemmatimonadetes bacterium]|nr:bifunctional DNA-formamidopyrimidine glycosylase/DNA-(apurinic or apyrimidinic site) lyase [Gemmatimonadota bacterium]